MTYGMPPGQCCIFVEIADNVDGSEMTEDEKDILPIFCKK